MGAIPGRLTVSVMMETARRQALEDQRGHAGAVSDVLALYGPRGDEIRPARPSRAAIPPEAVRPWPARPPRAECDAQPSRWAELRAARDPVPELFEGTSGMSSWSRALGWPVERALRSSPLDSWWYDPELPLSLILSGFPKWDSDGVRRDTGEETAAEFAAIVKDYAREMANGLLFPPLLALAFEPAADREAVPSRSWFATFGANWMMPMPHLGVLNGRHRAAAAWLGGRVTFPSFVIQAREGYTMARDHGPGWFGPVAEVAGRRGRTGVALTELAGLGPVRIVPDADEL
jgi:hypothetical protein